MTIKQRNNALEIAASLEYTGFPAIVIEADGTWRSPESTPHRPDCLVFKWGYEEGLNEYRYQLHERAGDEIHDENGKVSKVLIRDEYTRKTKWVSA